MGRAGFGDKVEGVHAVAAAAAAGRVETLMVERRLTNRDDIASIVRIVGDRGGSVREVDDVRSRSDTTAPQGVVAMCRPIKTVSLEEVAGVSKPAAVIVLDRIVDPHNLGAIIRSAVAAGIRGFVVSDRRAAPLGAASFKAAAGALELASVGLVSSVAESVAQLKRLGLWIVGLDAGGTESLFGLPLLTEPVAIVIGGESSGLSSLVADRADVVASIPMAGTTESLNASVAAALAAFEIFRVRRRT